MIFFASRLYALQCRQLLAACVRLERAPLRLEVRDVPRCGALRIEFVPLRHIFTPCKKKRLTYKPFFLLADGVSLCQGGHELPNPYKNRTLHHAL